MEKFVTLNNGIKMPRLGFGVYQIDDLAQAQQVVEDGLQIGYRLVDTAQIYNNEQAVGDAIKHSNVPREDIFITSKIWVDDYGYDNTLKAFEDSMKKLQLDYLDLYTWRSDIAEHIYNGMQQGVQDHSPVSEDKEHAIVAACCGMSLGYVSLRDVSVHYYVLRPRLALLFALRL